MSHAIELIRAHRHGGRDYPPGSILALSPSQAAWLQALGVARDVQPVPEPAPEPAKVPTQEHPQPTRNPKAKE